MKKSVILAVMLLLGACTAAPRPEDNAFQLPTMGWSSWNTYRVHITDSLIMRQADALVETGLAAAGYNHINIDDGYFGGRDAKTGQLLIHPKRFPGGLKPVVDHIHALGLKAGIYSDAGANTCGSMYDRDTIARGVGFYRHDQQDADFFFKEMGFDFIKVDFCGGNGYQNEDFLALDPRERYTAIREAINATGRPEVRLNVCRWDFPGIWVRDVAVSWRISHDISDNWPAVKSIISQSLYLSAYAGEGHYNDMDMLEVGRSLNEEEDKTHFGLWCIMASPLLIGCDMTTLREDTFALLTNPELIALNQDPLGLQAYVVDHSGDGYVLVKDIEERWGKTRAVAFYNSTDQPLQMSIALDALDLAGPAALRDLFTRTDLAPLESAISVEVPAHGTRIYKVTGTSRKERRLYEAETAWLSDYQELYNSNVLHTASYTPEPDCSGRMAVTMLGYTPTNDLQWRDVYSSEGGQYSIRLRCRSAEPGFFYLSVGSGRAARITVPAASGWQDVEATVTLLPGVNTIRLSNDSAPMPDIDCAVISPLR